MSRHPLPSRSRLCCSEIFHPLHWRHGSSDRLSLQASCHVACSRRLVHPPRARSALDQQLHPRPRLPSSSWLWCVELLSKLHWPSRSRFLRLLALHPPTLCQCCWCTHRWSRRALSPTVDRGGDPMAAVAATAVAVWSLYSSCCPCIFSCASRPALRQTWCDLRFQVSRCSSRGKRSSIWRSEERQRSKGPKAAFSGIPSLQRAAQMLLHMRLTSGLMCVGVLFFSRMQALAAAGDRDLWLLCVRPHDTEEHQPDNCLAALMLE